MASQSHDLLTNRRFIVGLETQKFPLFRGKDDYYSSQVGNAIRNFHIMLFTGLSV